MHQTSYSLVPKEPCRWVRLQTDSSCFSHRCSIPLPLCFPSLNGKEIRLQPLHLWPELESQTSPAPGSESHIWSGGSWKRACSDEMEMPHCFLSSLPDIDGNVANRGWGELGLLASELWNLVSHRSPQSNIKESFLYSLSSNLGRPAGLLCVPAIPGALPTTQWPGTVVG